MLKEINRIPYNNWINSQLSVAKFYGGIDINGDKYEFDIEEMKKLAKGEVDQVFPDLVLYGKVKK